MVDFNPADPAVRRNPYPFYAALRDEAPVYRIDPLGGIYAISRYDDVVFASMHPELFSSEGFTSTQIHDEPTKMMIFTDPPDHTRLRGLVNRAFTPRMVAELEPRIRQLTREMVDGIIEKGETDLIADLAIPLPVTIIAEILGVDPTRKEDFKRWSDHVVRDVMNQVPENEREAIQDDMKAFGDYFEAVVAERRAHPQADMISALVKAESEQQALTPDEVVAFIVLLLVAGNETTTNLIANAVIALIEHPDQLDRVRADRILLPNLVEEALRYDAPVQLLLRMTTQDVEIAGTTIPKGSLCALLYGSANHDERKYWNPEAFDVTRDTQGHVAFGHGIHFCLGAPLARLEGRIALEAIIDRLPELRRVEEEIEQVDSILLRGPKRLPLTFATNSIGSRA